MKTNIVIILFLVLCYVCSAFFYSIYRYNPSIFLLSAAYFLVLVAVWGTFWFFFKSSTLKYWYVAVASSLSTAVFLNGTVVIANQGFMPVIPTVWDKYSSFDYNYYIRGGNLQFLGDNIPIGSATVSMGDLFAGLTILISVILLLKIITEKCLSLAKTKRIAKTMELEDG